MSIRIMTQVWDMAELGQSETLVALALADHADDEGLCWPSIARIAEKARLSDRQTKRIIKRLEEMRIIEVDRAVGRNRNSRYQLIFRKGDMVSPFIEQEKGDIGDPEKVTSAPEKVTPGARKGDIAMSPEPPEPSRTVNQPSDARARANPDGRRQPAKATHLPDDFELTAERRAVAEAERLPAERTFAAFCDHWRAASGQRARKRDWDATWRNWCRREADRFGGSGGRARSTDTYYDDLQRGLRGG